MIVATFILAFVLGASADYQPSPPPQQHYQTNPSTYCKTSTRHITVTNTWGRVTPSEITSTAISHDHTIVPFYNTVIIPFTTVSTLTVTHLRQVEPEIYVSTLTQTNIKPVFTTVTHTEVKTGSTRLVATETRVQYMTLTKTLIKPSTTTLTTERLVLTHRHEPYLAETTTVTSWTSVTTSIPITVTWNNFRTATTIETVYVTKAHAKAAHVATTITEYDTVTKCDQRVYN